MGGGGQDDSKAPLQLLVSNTYLQGSGSHLGESLSSRDYWQGLEAPWVFMPGRTLLASSEQRAGAVLNVPQYTGWPHMQQRVIQPGTSLMSRLKTPL